MVSFRKSLSLVLSLMLLFSAVFQFSAETKAHAQTIATLSIGQTIEEWVFDEAAGYIYAVSKDANKLYFIRLSDLQIEKELIVGSAPSDVEMYNGKLYIPLSGSTTVAVVDIAQRIVEKALVTMVQPYKIGLDGTKMVYMQSGSSYLYEHDLPTGANKKVTTITSSVYSPDLVIDRTTHMLYMGESGTSGADAIKVRMSDYAVQNRSNYADNYGFPSPKRKILVDGTDVFYAGRQLDAGNLTIVDGVYQSQYYQEVVNYVKGKYVFTDKAIYDRDNFVKITQMPFAATQVAMDAANNIYMFNESTKSIQKMQLNLNLPVSNYQNVGNKLILDKDLTDWELDEVNGKIYAISRDSNRLLFIRSSDLVVEAELFVGSQPTDIDLYNGKLYVATNGATKVVVVDVATKVVSSTLNLTGNPYRIEVAADKVYYTEDDQSQYLRVYTISTKASTKLTALGLYSAPDLVLDRAANMLYIGESGTSGGDVAAVRTTDNTKRDISTYDESYGFPYPKRTVLKDGADVFYGGHRLNATKLAQVHGNYTEQIVYMRGNRVFSDNAVYDRESFVKVRNLPVTSKLVLMDAASNLYLWNSAAKTLQKENLDLTLPPAKGTSQRSGNQLLLDKKIADWVYDEVSGYIYAVSLETNRLMFIRANDLVVEDEMYIGSQPSDVDLYNGQLYVALSGSTKIVVADPIQKTIVKTMWVDVNPFRIEVDATKIFYTADDQWQYLRVLTTATGAVQKLTTLGSYYYPELLIDRENGKLYIGESGGSGSDVEVIRTTDHVRIANTTSGTSNNHRVLVKDGADLFFAGSKLDAINPGIMYGTYGSYSKVLAAKGNDVFTSNAIYDRNGFTKKAALPYVIDQLAMRSTGGFFAYSAEKNAIFLEVAPTVQSTTPSAGTQDFPPDTPISVTFNATVTAGSAFNAIEVRDASNNVIPVSKVLTGNQLVLTPSSPLQDGVTYVVTIPADAVQGALGLGMAQAYTFDFVVRVPADTVKPVVSSTTPADAATGVALGQKVTVTFSEAIAQGIAFNSIVLQDAVTNESVAVTKSIDGNVLTLQPTADAVMKGNTTYKVLLPAESVVDLVGNGLESQVVFTYTTVADPVPTPPPGDGVGGPVVASHTPTKTETEVPVTKPITITFSEDVLAGEFYHGILVTGEFGEEFAVTKSLTGNKLTIYPMGGVWEYYTWYVVTLPAGAVVDVDGNSLKEQYEFNFLTEF